LIAFAAYLDVVSLFFFFKPKPNGRRISGLPLLPVLLYVGGVFFLPAIIAGVHKGLLLLGLVCFHILSVFIVPNVTSVLSKRNNY